GSDAYNEARGKAQAFLDFVLAASVRGRNLANARQKADAIEDVVPILAAVRNTIQKRESFDQAMNFFRVDEAIRREIWSGVRKKGSGTDAEAIQKRLQRASQAKITVAEQLLLELLIYDRELQSLIFPTLEPSDYESLATAAVFTAL